MQPGDDAGRSCVYISYKVGDIELPCGTPFCMWKVGYVWLNKEMRAFLLSRKLRRIFEIIIGIPVLTILYFSLLCQTLSN